MTEVSDVPAQHLPSRLMGIRALGRALREARGTMSQGEAAARWNVPVSTLGALEQGVVRHYHSQTLARFDAMLGRSAVAIYESPDLDSDGVAALRDEFDSKLRRLSVEVREVQRLARPATVGDAFDALSVRLTPDQRARVVDFMRGLLAEP